MQPTYNDVFTYTNLVSSAEICIKNVSWKQSVQSFTAMMYMWCDNLHKQIMEHKYKSKGFHKFQIHERGKVRHIQSVHISERVVQKTLCQYALKPIIEPSLIYDNGASLKGKGQDFAVKRFREHFRWHYARYGLKGGILIGDFHNFFGSIDHNILLDMLRKQIKDNDIFELTKYFIECFEGDVGLGLGSEISQICAIFYPNKIDHTIKEKFRVHCYARYMDDFYIISEDIEKLKEVYNTILELAKELKLELNKKRTQIYKFEDIPTFTYLKCRTRLEPNGRISMRMVRDNVKRRRSWMRKQRELLDEGRVDFKYIKDSLQTWTSYALKRKNSYHAVKNICNYYKQLFAVEIMTEKEISKDLKRINQKLYFIEKKLNRQIIFDKFIYDKLFKKKGGNNNDR